MRKTACLIIFLFFAGPVLADFKIILKNGREFTVDDYKEADGKIRFFKSGGEIELDKGSIESIKKTKAIRPSEETRPSEPGKESQPDTASSEKNATAKKSESENRLNELIKKREALKAEGEKLGEERKKLLDDRNNKGMMLTIHQENEYLTKAAAIEEKIKDFNEQLGRLEQEIYSLAQELDIKVKKK